jgi:hypothetical protein
MALDFGDNTNAYRVDHGTLGSWNWGSGSGTVMSWFWVDADHDSSEFPTILGKSGGGNNGRFFLSWADNSELEFLVGGGEIGIGSSDNPVGTGKWNFGAATWDNGGVAGDQQLWYGDLSTPVAEVSSYGQQSVGGPGHDVSANSALVGMNSTTPDGEFDGKVAFVAAWDTVLTVGQMRAQQFSLLPLWRSNLKLFTHCGFNGVGTQIDWSGNGYTGSVTGATWSNHVPLPLPSLQSYLETAGVVGKQGIAPIYRPRG